MQFLTKYSPMFNKSSTYRNSSIWRNQIIVVNTVRNKTALNYKLEQALHRED